MTKTAVGQYTTDGRLWVDRLINCLEEIHEILDDGNGSFGYILDLIEKNVDEYNETYGKNATRNFARKRDTTIG